MGWRKHRSGRPRGQHVGVPPDPASEPRHERPLSGVREATEEAAKAAGTSVWRYVWQLIFLLVTAIALYGLAPKIVSVWSELPQLRGVTWWWFPALFVLEAASLACLWWLIRIALPGVSWFVAATAQMSGNAVSKTVPGGAPMGAALQYRMLSVAGVEPGPAASALGATGLLSAWVLFGLPFVALLLSLLGSPVPAGMVPVAVAGAAIFIIMFAIGIAIVKSDRLVDVIGSLVERANHWVMSKLGREGGITADDLRHQRAEILRTLGGNFRNALIASIGNWVFDYLVLVAALIAVGAEPRLSLVLLAYAVAAVLAMIPITPGGLGFVEAGLTAMLALAGISSSDALLATLAYRLYSYWLPLPAGLTAYLVFRHRFGRPPKEEETAADAVA